MSPGRANGFVSLTVEIDPSLVELEALAPLRSDPTFFWEQPDAGWLMAGFGAVWSHRSDPGPDRIASAAEAGAAVFERLTQAGKSDAPGPLLVGGFAFSDRPEAPAPDGDITWDEFPPGLLVLPQVTIQRRDDRAWVGAVVASSEGATSARSAIEDVVGRLETGMRPRREGAVGDGRVVSNGDDAFRGLVKQAVSEVESGKLAKVVAARAASVRAAADPWRVLDVLRHRYPSCATYGVFRRSAVFVGASPELLVALDGGTVTANALAGTIDRGSDELADARLEERLRHDPKELAEHQYVVQGLRRALSEAGVALDAPRSVEIVKLANVQHLASPVSGTVAPGTSILDLVDAVHPTPAVAGMPRSAALEWLAGNESLDRGWYAGPIGWMDSSLDGSFRVALRCALIEAGRARLFAGAGIVAGSQPDRELAETSAKLRAMLGALRPA